MHKPHPKTYRRMETHAAWLFLAPSLAGTLLFWLLPFVETVRRSFCDALGRRGVGFANYRAVLQNTAFRLAVQNTLRFICVCLPLLLGSSMALALALRARIFCRGLGTRAAALFKTSFLLPMAIPVASIALLWQALFAKNGLLNAWLGVNIDYMGTGAAFWVLIATYLWKNCGYDMVLWLSGLDGIPAALYEAAAVDGANAIQQFRYVTLPNLLPTLAMTAILSLLNVFKAFREVYLVAGSYPQAGIYQLQHLFNNWFLALDLPRLTAGAVLLALALLGVILILLRLWSRE